jgi:hypothetical protein
MVHACAVVAMHPGWAVCMQEMFPMRPLINPSLQTFSEEDFRADALLKARAMT